jgi:uncharacterized protein (DUF362 family)
MGLRFGEVIVEQNVEPTEIKRVVTELNLSPPVIIKPNWGTINNFTEAEIIDGVLSAIDGEAIVVESYGWARTKDALEGKGVGSKEKKDLRGSDRWFLDISGIRNVLQKHGAKYLNITEEVWAKRTVEKDVIRGIVEKEYPPVHFEEMYSWVPTRLFEMRDGTFLSLAKYRFNHDPIVCSLTLKNLFGMIPGPGRMRYHGKKDSLLAQSIVDINKIYRSVFIVKGMVDAVLTASLNREPKDAINPMTVKNKGLLLGSNDCVKLDAFVAAAEGKNPSEIEYLKLAATHFGCWDKTVLDQAKQSGIRIFLGSMFN